MKNCDLFLMGRLVEWNASFGDRAPRGCGQKRTAILHPRKNMKGQLRSVCRRAAAAALFAALCGCAVGASLPENGGLAFFHTATIDGREMIVAPDGREMPFLGIDHVRPAGWKDRSLGFDVYGRFVETNYPSKEAWLDETIDRLQDWGFNTLANHCDEPLLRHRGLAHTITLYLGGKFARGNDPDRWITDWRGPCTGFPNVFHPDFERAVRERARELCAPHRDDPDLMGWFLDNELKWWGATVARKDLTLFDTVRALPPEHTARKALEEFLTNWKTSHRDTETQSEPVDENLCASVPLCGTNDLREGFLRLVAERYFSVLCGAIREADPNHMILGCRFAAPFTATHPVVWEAAGRHCDIVSFNCYPWADLDRGIVLDEKGGVPVADRFRDIHKWCGKPLIVTEWSFPALDAGRPCFHGAGQRFPTQEGRAAATALYAHTMLSLPFVAGYSYFMFLDQPASGISETFREDSNYGLIDEFGRPYEAVTAALREVQRDGQDGKISRRDEETQRRRKQTDSLTPNGVLEDVSRVSGEQIRVSNKNLCVSVPLCGENTSPASGGWCISNACVRLEGGAAPGERPRLFLGGTEAGSLGALLQWRGPDGDIWTHAADYALLGLAPQSATIRATGGERPLFAITIRASLAPDSRALRAEILSVENLGDAPLAFSGVFLVPMPPDGTEPEPVVPNLWGAPERAWWRNPDGMVWGAVSDSPAARFRFWNTLHGRKEAAMHADARFTTGPEPVVLAPGATWRPSFPMEAEIGLREDFPPEVTQW